MNKAPIISVIMPVYNAEKYLKESIESILNQTFKDFEFIIINDASTDNSENIILSYTDLRINYIKNKKNIGVAKSLNKAIQNSKGKYIARMDADDISLTNRLEIQFNYMIENQNIDICASWINHFSNENERIIKTVKSNKEIKTLLLFYNPIPHPTIFMKKEIFTKYNLSYSNTFSKAEDYELWTRAIIFCRFSIIQETLLLYRIHTSQISKNFAELQKKQIIQIKNNYMLRLFKKEDIKEILHFFKNSKKIKLNKLNWLIYLTKKYNLDIKVLIHRFKFLNKDIQSHYKNNLDLYIIDLKKILKVHHKIVIVGYGSLGQKVHNELKEQYNISHIVEQCSSNNNTNLFLKSIYSLSQDNYLFINTILSENTHVQINTKIQKKFINSEIITLYF
ncbi:glycosyltransferase family 2 protein [Arcobacter sp.]|uniref:glycosyltransferase family 2 protein n=1 Tax=Arcobacter sp. TaxID=1872629 RepID=UPI003D09658D